MAQVVARLSTNQQLENIINEKIEPSVMTAIAATMRQENDMKNIGRSFLYSAGARAKLPKVKRKKKESNSPFTILEPYELPNRQHKLQDTFPPGVHDDAYRRVCNLTRKSMNDPESYQYTTTSMTEGLNYISGQPPW